MNDKKTELQPFIDMGLSYEEASHGVQCAIGYEIETEYGNAATPKHMRVGIDLSKAEQCGLARLLIDKGLFTIEEYIEYMRLAVNHELAYREAEHGGRIKFR